MEYWKKLAGQSAHSNRLEPPSAALFPGQDPPYKTISIGMRSGMLEAPATARHADDLDRSIPEHRQGPDGEVLERPPEGELQAFRDGAHWQARCRSCTILFGGSRPHPGVAGEKDRGEAFRRPTNGRPISPGQRAADHRGVHPQDTIESIDLAPRAPPRPPCRPRSSWRRRATMPRIRPTCSPRTSSRGRRSPRRPGFRRWWRGSRRNRAGPAQPRGTGRTAGAGASGRSRTATSSKASSWRS